MRTSAGILAIMLTAWATLRAQGPNPVDNLPRLEPFPPAPKVVDVPPPKTIDPPPAIVDIPKPPPPATPPAPQPDRSPRLPPLTPPDVPKIPSVDPPKIDPPKVDLPKADLPPLSPPPGQRVDDQGRIVVPGTPPATMAPPAVILEPGTPTMPVVVESRPTVSPIFDWTVETTFARHRVWGGVDYSLWWFRPMAIPAPLAVSTTSTGGAANILGVDPNARVILGNESLAGDPGSGGRFWAGVWFDRRRSLGVEVAGLWVDTPTRTWSVASNAVGMPMIARPVVLTGLGPAVYDVSFPGFLAGDFAVATQQTLQGLEANLVGFALGDHRLALDLLAGGRFLNLEESIRMDGRMSTLVPLPAFGPDILPTGTSVSVVDRFRTSNEFFGGQVGARLETTFGRLSVSLAGKLAVGSTDMTLDIDGSTLRGDTGQAYAAGILANAGNVGRYRENHLTWIPEGNATIGWWFTPNLRVKVGYNVLYISEVVRPGCQISTAVNPAGVPVDMLYGTATVPRVSPLFHRTDFWAEGLTFGVDFRY